MRRSMSLSIAAVVVTLATSGMQVAVAWDTDQLFALSIRQDLLLARTAWQPNRLSALAARQSLRDEVSIALADGRISPDERYQILAIANGILKPEEYEGFKRSFDRLSPPRSTAAKRLTKIARNSTQLPPPVKREAQAASADSSALVMPTSVTLPDNPVASAIRAW